MFSVSPCDRHPGRSPGIKTTKHQIEPTPLSIDPVKIMITWVSLKRLLTLVRVQWLYLWGYNTCYIWYYAVCTFITMMGRLLFMVVIYVTPADMKFRFRCFGFLWKPSSLMIHTRRRYCVNIHRKPKCLNCFHVGWHHEDYNILSFLVTNGQYNYSTWMDKRSRVWYMKD